MIAVIAATAAAQVCDPAGAAGVVINEFFADPPSTDDGREWVELHNPGDHAVDVSGWALAAGTSSFAAAEPLPPDTTLEPGAFLVVAERAGPVPPLVEADVYVEGLSLGNASSDADGLTLLDCEGSVADTVIYGGPNDDGWVGDHGDQTLAPVEAGAASGRMPDGRDSDRNDRDFEVLPYATPGQPNDAPPETCGGPGSGLLLTELSPDPDGADDGFEWVELLHTGDAPIDLTGWSLAMGTSSVTTKHTWSSGLVRPGERLLVGGAAVVGADVVAPSLSLGNASSDADVVAILDCRGFASDTVVYGAPNPSGFVDDTGEVATRFAPVAPPGGSLRRVDERVDTDDNEQDWVVSTSPTPGEPNPPIAPTRCAEGAPVRLNEFVPDPDGADEGLEWVELYNPTDTPVLVEGWQLVFATSDASAHVVTLPGGTELAAQGFLVVGGPDAPAVDVAEPLSLGNGTETDAIELVDCAETLVDSVLYGEAPNLDGLVDEAGGTEPYGAPGAAEALARVEDGVDTDAPDDWRVVGVPTPGATNVVDASSLGEGWEEPGCGGPRAPGPQGCSTRPGPPLGFGVLLALWWRRRR